jgi:adenylate cyclase
MRLNLRAKLMIFAIAIAIVPLLVAGRTMIRIAQDELKSSANEQLITTAAQLTAEVNDLHERTWLAPLLLIRSALDDERLGVQEKIAILTHGISQLPDIVALQLTVEGSALPVVVARDDFAARLRAAGLDPLGVLRVPAPRIAELRRGFDGTIGEVSYIRHTDDWLATLAVPLSAPLAGGEATLSARIDLERLRRMIADHPFNRTGIITILDRGGYKLFDPARPRLTDYTLAAEAVELLATRTPIVSVEPHRRPSGETMLGTYAFPRPFPWAILVEKSERNAYLAIERMVESLGWWVLIGLAIAGAGAILFALRISQPILRIDRVANRVAQGDFQARVEGVRSRDEIGDLATRINEMIVGLNERFQLAKFVSGGTLAAIRLSDHRGVSLGGERRPATMLFCDIRGYTAFAEQREPETVVESLNFYFQHLADVVTRHRGDIDKFVGDQIVAVFLGQDMVADAVRCAAEMQRVMAALRADRPDWDLAIGIGISSGEVVVGAMGSKERMDFTVLGDHVNLAARLCSQAGRGQTLLAEPVQRAIAGNDEFTTVRLEPIAVKGKSERVAVYELLTAPAPATPLSALGGAQ